MQAGERRCGLLSGYVVRVKGQESACEGAAGQVGYSPGSSSTSSLRRSACEHMDDTHQGGEGWGMNGKHPRKPQRQHLTSCRNTSKPAQARGQAPCGSWLHATRQPHNRGHKRRCAGQNSRAALAAPHLKAPERLAVEAEPFVGVWWQAGGSLLLLGRHIALQPRKLLQPHLQHARVPRPLGHADVGVGDGCRRHDLHRERGLQHRRCWQVRRCRPCLSQAGRRAAVAAGEGSVSM